MKYKFVKNLCLGWTKINVYEGGIVDVADDHSKFTYQGKEYTDMRDILICIKNHFVIAETEKKEKVEKKEKKPSVIVKEVVEQKAPKSDRTPKAAKADKNIDTKKMKVVEANEKSLPVKDSGIKTAKPKPAETGKRSKIGNFPILASDGDEHIAGKSIPVKGINKSEGSKNIGAKGIGDIKKSTEQVVGEKGGLKVIKQSEDEQSGKIVKKLTKPVPQEKLGKGVFVVTSKN